MKQTGKRWLFLLSGITINAIGVAMVAFGEFGISAISSFPYGLHKAFPVFSFGVWSYLFQIFLILVILCLTRTPDIQYLLSFGVSILYGYILDGFEFLFRFLPPGLPLRCLFYAAGTFVMAVGTCLAVESRLPALPHDIFLRELSRLKGWEFSRVKTVFDCCCVLGSCVLGLAVNRAVQGVGIGTVISAAVMGKCIGLSRRRLAALGVLPQHPAVNNGHESEVGL